MKESLDESLARFEKATEKANTLVADTDKEWNNAVPITNQSPVVKQTLQDAARLGLQVAEARLIVNVLSKYMETQDKALQRAEASATEAHENAVSAQAESASLSRRMNLLTAIAVVFGIVSALASVASVLVAREAADKAQPINITPITIPAPVVNMPPITVEPHFNVQITGDKAVVSKVPIP